jgi:hypothetical protein
MPIATRTLLSASCFALVAVVGCGGRVSGPTGPSGSTEATGATIAGTVNGGNMVSFTASAVSAGGLTTAAAPSGMSVTVVGTNLTTSVDILGQFQLAGVPSGNVQLQFRHGSVSAAVQLSNVGQEELVQIQVNVNGTTATIVNDVRSTGKKSLCHTTGNGSYHLIEVSVSAEPAHRAHGDGAVGDRVPADTTKVFDVTCQALAAIAAGVRIKKSTNGQDADEAPGPTLAVGSPVAWEYVVTNTGQAGLTNVLVVDDRGVAVSCPGTTLAIGQSMTCTGSGVATEGQYRNVGTATADSAASPVRDSDASHYFGQAVSQEVGPKVKLCHRTGNGQYHLIEISTSAEAAHRAHGDAKIGEPVPGSPGKMFSPSCGVS